MSNVLYLNAWLNCPDEILRNNYAYQDRFSEARVKFFYDLKEKGASEWQITNAYQRFIHDNRDRIRLVTCNENQEA